MDVIQRKPLILSNSLSLKIYFLSEYGFKSVRERYDESTSPCHILYVKNIYRLKTKIKLEQLSNFNVPKNYRNLKKDAMPDTALPGYLCSDHHPDGKFQPCPQEAKILCIIISAIAYWYLKLWECRLLSIKCYDSDTLVLVTGKQ